MKSSGLWTAAAALLLMVGAPSAGASTPGAPGTFVRLTDSLSQTLHWVRSGSGERIPEMRFRGRFSVQLQAPLIESEFEFIDEATPVHISIGDFEFSALLGDDPGYRAGRRSARFVVRAITAAGRSVRVLEVSLRWDRRRLRAILHGLTPIHVDPLIAGRYLGAVSGPVRTETEASIDFGASEAAYTVNLSGLVRTRIVPVDGSDEEVSRVKFEGLGFAR